MNRTMWICVFALACGVLAACPGAQGGLIPVANPGFEDLLAEGGATATMTMPPIRPAGTITRGPCPTGDTSARITPAC